MNVQNASALIQKIENLNKCAILALQKNNVTDDLPVIDLLRTVRNGLEKLENEITIQE